MDYGGSIAGILIFVSIFITILLGLLLIVVCECVLKMFFRNHGVNDENKEKEKVS